MDPIIDTVSAGSVSENSSTMGTHLETAAKDALATMSQAASAQTAQANPSAQTPTDLTAPDERANASAAETVNNDNQFDETNLIVNYLPYDMNEKEMKDLFDSYGEIVQVKVVKNKLTNVSLGYGFVRFASSEAALKAIAGTNGVQVRNKRIKVSLARKSSAEIVRSNLYVAGIPTEFDESALQELFSAYGKTIEVKILRDQATGNPRGAGFVRFSLNSEAQAAINALNGYAVPGKNSNLTVKFADDGHRDRQQYQAMALAMQGFNMGGGLMVGGYGGRAAQFSMQSPLMGYPQMFAGGRQSNRMPRPTRGGFANGNAVRAQANAVGAPPTTWCLFVYNLPQTCDDALLFSMFSAFGHVTSAKVQRDPKTRASRGFGFVNFPDFAQAQLAIQTMNGAKMGDKQLQVSFKTHKF